MKKIVVLLLLIVSSNVFAGLKECMTWVSEINKGLPMNIGDGITIDGIGCKEEDNRVVVFYRNSVETNRPKIEDTISLKKYRVNAACTTKNMRETLNEYDLEWLYYNSQAIYMGGAKVKKEDCIK